MVAINMQYTRTLLGESIHMIGAMAGSDDASDCVFEEMAGTKERVEKRQQYMKTIGKLQMDRI